MDNSKQNEGKAVEIKIHNGISKKIGLLAELNKVNISMNREVIIDDIDDYKTKDFENDFNTIGNNIIYIISTNKLPFTYDEVNEKFSDLKNEYKKKNLDYHISKINDKKIWENKRDIFCLYVGSKRDNAKSRFKQHIGLDDLKSRSTYSLWLKDWCPNNIKIHIAIYEFSPKINSESLQIIEDILWDEYEPLLGKRGANGVSH